jgi:hypothetical protein
MAELIPDVPEERELDIYEKCGKHAQTMKVINDVLIQIGNINLRLDAIVERLVKLEKTRDEKLDTIIDMLKNMHRGPVIYGP